MQIDWLTVAAQIVNFLILVWLLQRFLYRPISAAMRRREERIETRLAEARQAREKAEEEAGRLRQKEQALEKSKDDALAEARTEAAKLREELEAELREEIEEKRATWHGQLEEERDEFARTLQRRAGREVLDIAERIVGEFADSDLSERIATAFAARLDALDDEARDRLAAAAGRAQGATMETGHPIGPEARDRITAKLHEVLSAGIAIDFSEDEEMSLGARLTVGEQTVEWSAARYLKRLEAALNEILDSELHAAPSSEEAATDAPEAAPTRAAR